KDREVLHLHASVLHPNEPSEPSVGANGQAETQEKADSSRRRSDGPGGQPSAETVRNNGQKHAEPSAGGRFGRSGKGVESAAAEQNNGAHQADGWGDWQK